MPQKTFRVPENVRIEINACENRVQVTGWNDSTSLQVDALAQQEGDVVRVENISATIRAPRSASVIIKNCEADIHLADLSGKVEIEHNNGDVALRNLTGPVTIRDLEGDLIARSVSSLEGQGVWDGDTALRAVDQVRAETIEGDISLGDVGFLSVETVEGDLAGRALRGDLRAGSVHGDVSLRDVAGAVHIDEVGDDFAGSGLAGQVELAHVDGDASLSLMNVKGLQIQADGDIAVNLPVGAAAEIELDAPHGEWALQGDVTVADEDEHHVRGRIGTGGPVVRIESNHGDIAVRLDGESGPRDPIYVDREHFRHIGREMAEMGQQIAAQVMDSVDESLGSFRSQHHRHHQREHIHRHRQRHDERASVRDPDPAGNAEAPAGPIAGSSERKEILDAIARGELSVDDAIRKLRGER